MGLSGLGNFIGGPLGSTGGVGLGGGLVGGGLVGGGVLDTADPQGGGDTLNIDDMLTMLCDAQTQQQQQQQQQGMMSAPAASSTQVTHAMNTWSNMPANVTAPPRPPPPGGAVMPRAAAGPAPLTLVSPGSRVLPPGLRSPISPGFSPAPAAGFPVQRRSPAAGGYVNSPSPLGVARSPAQAFQVSPNSGRSAGNG